MISPFRALLLSCLLTSGSCKVSELKPISFPTDYRPEGSAGAITVVPACAVYREFTVLDQRPDKHNAGIRTIQDRPDRSDIFIEGDVAAWFRAGVERGLALAQFPQDSGAKLDLTFKLAGIHIEEIAYRNSTFEGRVVIDIELREPGSSGHLWTDRVDGTAENYGRPGNPENYRETINHALDRAVASALNNTELRSRLCGTTSRARLGARGSR
jgi:hypothetical protein